MTNSVEDLATLKSLLDQGVISQDEFDLKKKEFFSQSSSEIQQKPEEGGTMGWSLLGFFIPLVGLILFLVWKDSKPEASSASGKGALTGFIVSIVLSIVYVAAVMYMLG